MPSAWPKFLCDESADYGMFAVFNLVKIMCRLLSVFL